MINLSYQGSPRGLMNYIGFEICENCYGEGLVKFYERDSSGNLADTGIKACFCQKVENEDRIEE